MSIYRWFLAIASVCVLLSSARAQPPNLEPNSPHFKPVPTVTFEVAFPGAAAEHYAISLESSGAAAYHSDNLGRPGPKESTASEPYISKFTISATTCMRIFNLAKRANYFRGEFSAIYGPVANASITTLSYSEGWSDSFGHRTNGVRNSTSFSYTKNPAALQLMSIFEGISNSLELGRRIDYLHRFDQPALEDTLKRAEVRACGHQLVELNIIQQSLRSVADDPSVSNDARQSARRLLLLAQSSPQSETAPNPAWCHYFSGGAQARAFSLHSRTTRIGSCCKTYRFIAGNLVSGTRWQNESVVGHI